MPPEKNIYFMSTDNTEIVDGLLKWWNGRFGIVPGSRNANLYKLAAALNNYGIPVGDALEVCLRYVNPSGADPFTAGEITATVASAYRRTEHGVKEWTQGTRPRDYPPRPPRRTLSEAQARAVEDRLVEVLRRQWQTVSTPPPPIEVMPAPIIPAMLPSQAERKVLEWATINPAIHGMIRELGLELNTATISTINGKP